MLRASRPLSTARRSGAARMSFALVLGAVLVAVAGSAAMAQASGKSSSSSGKNDSFCASYGAGFQRVPGTDSCVRSGAAVRTDAYSGGSVSSAPNQFNNSITPSQPSAAPDPWKSAR